MKAARFSPFTLRECALTSSNASASCPQQRASSQLLPVMVLGRDSLRGGDCVCPVPAVPSGGRGRDPLLLPASPPHRDVLCETAAGVRCCSSELRVFSPALHKLHRGALLSLHTQRCRARALPISLGLLTHPRCALCVMSACATVVLVCQQRSD